MQGESWFWQGFIFQTYPQLHLTILLKSIGDDRILSEKIDGDGQNGECCDQKWDVPFLFESHFYTSLLIFYRSVLL